MKKVIFPGLVAGVATLIVGLIISYLFMLFPSVAADYNPPLMRQWQDPLMMLFFAYPFVQGIIFAWAWNKSKSLFKDKRNGCRGRKFGFAMFLITTIPGMIVTYTSFNLSFLTVLGWTVSGFVNALLAGTIFAAMNK